MQSDKSISLSMPNGSLGSSYLMSYILSYQYIIRINIESHQISS